MLQLDINKISDISTLVDSIEIGYGDELDLRYNYLDLSRGSHAMNDIQTLLARGVNVDYEPQKELTSPITSLLIRGIVVAVVTVVIVGLAIFLLIRRKRRT